jgi:hypothetical protein
MFYFRITQRTIPEALCMLSIEPRRTVAPNSCSCTAILSKLFLCGHFHRDSIAQPLGRSKHLAYRQKMFRKYRCSWGCKGVSFV